MKTNLMTNRIKPTVALISSAFMIALVQTAASAENQLTWDTASKDDSTITRWLRRVILVVMAIFIMVAVILGSLAFKQLSADGNWKDFWSKIAGAIGMFVVPVAVWWAVNNNG